MAPIGIELAKIFNLVTIDDNIINCNIQNLGQFNTNWSKQQNPNFEKCRVFKWGSSEMECGGGKC